VRAAQLLAAAEAALAEKVFDPDEQPEFDGAVERTRRLLGDEFAAAWDAGRALTRNDAVAEALG
jgi:hypothetical protein